MFVLVMDKIEVIIISLIKLLVIILLISMIHKISMHDEEIENLYTITQQQQELIDMYIKG